jgi:hypothetical protein
MSWIVKQVWQHARCDIKDKGASVKRWGFAAISVKTKRIQEVRAVYCTNY